MRLAFPCLLLLAACSAEPPAAQQAPRPTESPPAAQQAPRPTQSPPAAAQVSTLAGEWRIAGIDGKPFDESYGLALSADDKEIWWAPRCVGLIRTYKINGTAIRIGPAKGLKPVAPGQPSPPVCAIGLPPRIDEVTRALDSATMIRRTPSNGVAISGGRRSLLLFTQ